MKDRMSTEMPTISHKPVENGFRNSSQERSSCNNCRMKTLYLEVMVIKLLLSKGKDIISVQLFFELPQIILILL
jgi:hypothetical protein